MSHARKPRPRIRRLPDWLRDSLGQVLAILTTALALAFVGIVSPAPVGGECPGGERRPVAAVVRDDGGRIPESEPSTPGMPEARDGLSRGDVVGRDGIEPPTLRFSAAGPGVQQVARMVTVLVR